ncbi:hypothetical protein EME01_52200 [Sinorhizobium meliloti]|uniref:Resolvase/invertase-type recombinase catalytic domain-containing protein n=3 Tax=Rhizobium meliloti TaxID=382 RepID=Q1WLJ1_SINMM|nr:hypothetical protein [Sinorhizobium meliloti]GEC41148.1 hypothetical protein EME01_52200 [Sinorhizobium meliloti]
MGRMVITILGMVADMELKFIKDRQRAGIDAAKAEGVYKGRKKYVDDDEIRKSRPEFRRFDECRQPVVWLVGQYDLERNGEA